MYDIIARDLSATTTPSMKPNGNNLSKSFSFDWKFPFGDDNSNPKEKKDASTVPASEESNNAATKDAAEKAFVFETPTRQTKK